MYAGEIDASSLHLSEEDVDGFNPHCDRSSSFTVIAVDGTVVSSVVREMVVKVDRGLVYDVSVARDDDGLELLRREVETEEERR